MIATESKEGEDIAYNYMHKKWNHVTRMLFFIPATKRKEKVRETAVTLDSECMIYYSL